MEYGNQMILIFVSTFAQQEEKKNTFCYIGTLNKHGNDALIDELINVGYDKHPDEKKHKPHKTSLIPKLSTKCLSGQCLPIDVFYGGTGARDITFLASYYDGKQMHIGISLSFFLAVIF